MSSQKQWPYPLAVGTQVVARVRKLDLSGDVDVVGSIVRQLKVPSRATVNYAVKLPDGGLVEVLASNTVPIDTSTEAGLDLWLGAISNFDVDSAELPGPDLTDSNSFLRDQGAYRTTVAVDPRLVRPSTTSTTTGIYIGGGASTTTGGGFLTSSNPATLRWLQGSDPEDDS